MNNIEAKEILKDLWCYAKTDKYTDEEIREAIDQAIKALNTMPFIIDMDNTITRLKTEIEHLKRIIK